MDRRAFKKAMRFLGGLKMAVVLISLVAVVMIVATVYERSVDPKGATGAVYRVFYGSFWFGCMLVLLAVNVTVATLNRWPWKWRQAGFLMTHLAIVVIVVGSMVTRFAAVEGTVRLREGQSTSEMRLREDILAIGKAAGQGGSVRVPVDVTRGPARHAVDVSLGSATLPVTVTRYYANSVDEHVVQPADDQGRPAVRLTLEVQPGPGHTHVATPQSVWLMAGDARRAKVQLGKGGIRLAAAKDAATVRTLLDANVPPPSTQPTGQPPLGTLHVDLGERGQFRIPVQAGLGKPTPLGTTGIHVRIKSYLPSAVVRQGGLVNRGPEPTNPAVVVELLKADGRQETHSVFAQFPTFDSMHGKKTRWSGAKLRYEFTAPTAGGAKEVLLVAGPDHRIHYSMPDAHGQAVEGEATVGQVLAGPWGDQATVRIAESVSHGRWTTRPRQAPAGSSEKGARPAIQLALGSGRQAKSLWLVYGQKETAQTPQGNVAAYFGPRRQALGFSLTLVDFRIKRYSGSTMPASYESDVQVTDSRTGTTIRRTVRMNRPLTVAGYTLYQSSYQGETTSILSAAYDPGTPVVYVGFIVLIVGIFVATVLQWIRDYRRRRRRLASVGAGVVRRAVTPASTNNEDLSECVHSASQRWR